MLALEGKSLGNYDVIKRIRSGGMGAVYEGRQRTAFDRRVAIKVILGDYAADLEMRRRFAREAKTVARLHHPHILPLIEFGDEQGVLYLVMPFIEGGTLTSYLRGSLPALNEVAGIYQQLLDAVEYAHEQGLIHRDIKSSNVLLEMRRNSFPYVYLADFGLVRTARQAEVEQTGELIPLEHVPGTPHYMAPEQTRGIVTPLTDIYALGVLLYQMLTGELPYDDPDDVRVIQMHLYDPIPSPSERDASIPSELSDVVRRAMAKRPEDRYQSIAEFRTAFLAALEDRGVPTVEEDSFANDVMVSPRRPFSTPLRLPEAPVPEPLPIPMPLPLQSRRSPRVAVEPPRHSTLRTTDSVKGKLHTTGPIVYRRRRLTFSLVVAAAVPLILILLLLLPRVFSMSLFPTGFPLFGASPVATVSITPQSRVFQNTFLVTASPLVQSSNLSTHIIPARILHENTSGSRSTQSTGTSSTPGVQARGMILFVNTDSVPVLVPGSTIFATSSGVQIQLTADAKVPAQTHGKKGTFTAPAIAVTAGTAGNISVNALATVCCTGLFVTNPQPFSGGSDGNSSHVLLQSDLDRVSTPLIANLEQQVTQQFQKQLHKDEAIAGQPSYTLAVSSDSPVGASINSAQVSVKVSATVSAYNRETAGALAVQLLTTQATQTLGSNYQLQGKPTMDTPKVVEQNKKGIVSLSVPVSGLWSYYFAPQQLNQWSSAIKGTSLAVAVAYLNSRPGVAAVQIHLPFGTDHLPSSTDNITILLTDK
ncbi:MAG: protein kinase [Chloroflexota bacterium]|nr:protein kinase [Chloroflexota bacterium]